MKIFLMNQVLLKKEWINVMEHEENLSEMTPLIVNCPLKGFICSINLYPKNCYYK